jgi:hypothetical protein
MPSLFRILWCSTSRLKIDLTLTITMQLCQQVQTQFGHRFQRCVAQATTYFLLILVDVEPLSSPILIETTNYYVLIKYSLFGQVAQLLAMAPQIDHIGGRLIQLVQGQSIVVLEDGRGNAGPHIRLDDVGVAFVVAPDVTVARVLHFKRATIGFEQPEMYGKWCLRNFAQTHSCQSLTHLMISSFILARHWVRWCSVSVTN